MLQEFISYYTTIVASCHLMIVIIVMNGKVENVNGDEELLDFIQKRNLDRKSTRLNSSHMSESRMPSSA